MKPGKSCKKLFILTSLCFAWMTVSVNALSLSEVENLSHSELVEICDNRHLKGLLIPKDTDCDCYMREVKTHFEPLQLMFHLGSMLNNSKMKSYAMDNWTGKMQSDFMTGKVYENMAYCR